MKSTIALVGLAALPSAYAWGSMAHQAVALVGQRYLTAATAKWVTAVLNDAASIQTTSTGDIVSIGDWENMTNDELRLVDGIDWPNAFSVEARKVNTSATATMASVATWADSFRSTKEGAFSSPFHFIDAEDSPPDSCGVNVVRDCGASGCVISAIANYTSRLIDPTLGADQHTDAMKFLIHFFGDITQPLHCEAADVGGNKIAVTFDNKKTNLHSVWDSAIPQQAANGSTLDAATAWSKQIVKSITSGPLKKEKKKWTNCVNLDAVEDCALEWAVDTNGFVCSYVFKDGIDSLNGQEIGGDYATGGEPIVELQVAKGGVRLAAWLNAIHARLNKKNRPSTRANAHTFD